MALSPPFRFRHLMLLEAASWHGSSHLLLLLLEVNYGTRSATRNLTGQFMEECVGRVGGGRTATNLLNFSLVVSFQGSSLLSAGDAILSVAGAAAHLRGTRERWLFNLRLGGGAGEKIDASAGVVTFSTLRGATRSCDKIRAPSGPALCQHHFTVDFPS